VDYWRAAIVAGGIRPGVLLGWSGTVRRIQMELPVLDGQTRIPSLGAALVGEMIVSPPHSGPGVSYEPAGLLDNKPVHRRMRIRGARALGSRADLPAVSAIQDPAAAGLS
jgi:hypothetical protein